MGLLLWRFYLITLADDTSYEVEFSIADHSGNANILDSCIWNWASYTLVAPIPLGVGDFYLLNSWFYEEFPQISPCPLWVWDSSSEWKSSKDAYPQAPMKIIKPLAGGFIIGEIFPKFRIGLLRDHENYSRWHRKCKYFEISDSQPLCRSLDFLRSHQYIHPDFATPQEGNDTDSPYSTSLPPQRGGY